MKTDNPLPAARTTIAGEESAVVGRFAGWRVLAMLWLIFMSFSLMVYGGSILNAYMAKALQMPRDSFGGGVSLAYLLMGLAAPLTALLLRWLRPRLTLVLGMLLFAASALTLGTLVRGALGFTVAYGLIAGLGFSVGGLLPLQALVAAWFVRRRSLATAIMLSAGGFGGLLGSYLFSYLIEQAGMTWQNVWLLIGGFSLLLALAALLILRNHPDDLGQAPDGVLRRDPAGVQPAGPGGYRTEHEWTFKEAIRTRAVWLIFAGSLGMAISFEFCSAYGVIHLMDIGFPNVAASVSVGILALFAIVGRLLTGYIGDRAPLRWVMVVGSLLIAVGCLLVIAPRSTAIIQLYALMAGLGQGLVFVALFTIMPNYFGARALPSIFALSMPLTSIVMAGTIFLGGVIRSNTGSYTIGFVLCAVIAVGAAGAAVWARPPSRP